MTAPVRFPRFFVTSPAPCPYLPGKTERKVFTELKGPHSEQLNDALGRIGFRRSQTVAYRPSCEGCKACVSVRVAAHDFAPSKAQRRVINRNADLIVTECRPWATAEQFVLLQKYLEHRHPGGGMAAMDEVDYADMVEHTSVSSFVIEYREQMPDGGAGRLVAACLTDRQADGLSMIYSFYDPEIEDRNGLGNFVILDHIRRASEAGLPYVYLGYWVEGSDRMRYKVRFRPLEVLSSEGWRRLGDAEQRALIESAASGAGLRGPATDGCTKDNAPSTQAEFKLA
ncbi:arginyltransferase [Aurantiacibacter gangjinensis]|uniref:Aspartate/glutamate leucyltransferase n=1 Tax=Aurantiacibacter gangjinensis TaxID=502682 RepID=A0A0G9MSN8_9SPHN|nr:arginyltransferase [Aurantiacibacter gangjinensis]APE27046.1 Arginine-tRNA-protein transferase [Aurantiacibacter gangjinensis]KLE33726.1 arginyl-tRNA-protein transferase [Aurantiacibacter gangjinensis]